MTRNTSADMMRAFLAIAAVSLVVTLLIMLRGGAFAPDTSDIAMVIVGGVLAKFSEVYSWFFGSSQGSMDKTHIMAEQPAGTPADPVSTEEIPSPRFGKEP